jgi:hypothetical protein
MGMGGSKKSSAPKTGADGLPRPSVTSAVPTAGNPIPRQSVAVQEKLSEQTKSASLLQDEDELMKKGLA